MGHSRRRLHRRRQLVGIMVGLSAAVAVVVAAFLLARSQRGVVDDVEALAEQREAAAARETVAESTLQGSTITQGRVLEAASHLRGDPKGAIADARRMLEEDPRSQEALDLLTLAYDRVRALGLSQAEEATLREEEIDDYRRVLRRNPDWPEVLFRSSFHRLALQRLRPGDSAQAQAAVSELRRLIDTLEARGAVQDLPAAHNQLGRAYRHLGDAVGLKRGPSSEIERFYALALARFRTVLGLDPNRVDALGETVLVYQATKAFDQARDAVASHLPKITSAEARAKAFEMLGALYIQLGKSDQAIETFHAALEVDDSLQGAYLYLSQLYSERGSMQQAEETLRVGLRTQPRFLEAHLQLAQLLQQQSRFADAITSLETALQIDPSEAMFMGAGGAAAAPSRNLYRNRLYYSAAASIAWLYLENAHEPKKALAAVDRARQYEEAEPHLLDTLGWIYHALGDDERAVATLQSAAMRESFPAVHYHLAQIYRKQGRLEMAKHEVQESLRSGLEFEDRQDAERLNRYLDEQLTSRTAAKNTSALPR